MIYNILENSDAVSGVTLKNSPNSSTLLLDRADGKGRMTFHTLFPGLTLAFIFVNAPVWPESDENSNLKPLLINYCVSGRSELLLDDGSYIYLKENDFCVSEQTAQKEYIFPTRQYQGIKIYFDLPLLLQSCGELLKSFSLDLPTLEENYCGNHKTYINEADALLTCSLTLTFPFLLLLFLLVHLCQQLYQGRFQNLCSDFSSFDAQ